MEDIKKEKSYSFWNGLIIGIVSVTVILTVVFIVVLNRNASEYKQIIRALNEGQYNFGFQGAFQTGEDDGEPLANDAFVAKANMIFDGVVEEFYFDEDIDKNLMRENMYKAVIAPLNDRYAEYYTAEELNTMMTESEGIYYGIGSYVMMDEETGYPILSGVFKDSPASEAGLRDGDIIYEVNGENYYGCTLTEWVNLIKGPEYTTVDLTIYRKGEPDYLHFTVERRQVESPTVEYEMLDNNIGYLQITEFDDVTTSQFMNAYTDLCDNGMVAMVLDLRSNGGGNLDTVLAISEELLPEGIITYTEDRNGYREEYRCKGEHEIQIPVAVLTNEYTASASELLTGALKAYDKAVTIGTNTFGKGIVQTIYPLADGSGVKITTSRYYTPDGNCIHEVGIAPDFEIEFDGEAYYAEESVDNQLEYAKNYLMQVIYGVEE